MARRDENTEAQPNNDVVTTDGAAAAGAVTETKGDQRFKKVNVPQNDGSVSVQNRTDVIRGLWKGEKDTPAVGNLNPEGKKWARGDIARKLSDLTGEKVIYQIVFAGTKGIPGGPDKAATTSPETTPADAQG